MPATDSPAVIVARFLKANHYYETFEAFLQEAGLPEDAGTTSPGDWTVELILEEKKQYDTSLAFEKKGNDGNQGWSKPAPAVAVEPLVPSISNVLCVAGDSDAGEVLVSGADRSWTSFSGTAPYGLALSIKNAHSSPILSIKPVSQFLLSTSMSGQLMLHHAPTGQLVNKCRHHLKYAVQVAVDVSEHGWIIATAGWDQKVFIYAPDHRKLDTFDIDSTHSDDEPLLPNFFGEPIHTITLPSNPESMLFVRHPDTSGLYLVLTRRDSTHLHYYSIDITRSSSDSQHSSIKISPAGRQNLAPHSNAWVAFTPSSISLCPTDPTLVAIATSHLPHLKLIVVRLLFPDANENSTASPNQSNPNGTRAPPLTQASQARASLALQDREDAAIRLHVTTLAPQTPYSTPAVVWRPDGSGVFVNGDDGVIRGVEVQSGKVVCLLRAHEVGTKVRTLWAGYLKSAKREGEERTRREVLVSGGFDKKVFVWEAEEAVEAAGE